MAPKAPAGWNLWGLYPGSGRIVRDSSCAGRPPSQGQRESGQAFGRCDRIPEKAESDQNRTWGFVEAQIINEEGRTQLGEGRRPGGKGQAPPWPHTQTCQRVAL